MSKLKSCVLGLVMFSVGLLVVACPASTESSSEPSLIRSAAPGGLYTKKAGSKGDGSSEDNPVEYTVPVLAARYANAAQRSLEGLYRTDDVSGTVNFEVIESVSGKSEEKMGIRTGTRSILNGALSPPQAAGYAKIRVEDGLTGNYLYLKITFTPEAPMLTAMAADGVDVGSATMTVDTETAGKEQRLKVVVPSKGVTRSAARVSLKDLVPYDGASWSLLANSDQGTGEKTPRNRLIDGSETPAEVTSGGSLPVDAVFVGLGATQQPQEYQPSAQGRAVYGTVKLKASLQKSTMLEEPTSYYFTLVFPGQENTLSPQTGATVASAGLVFGSEEGDSMANAITVTTKKAGDDFSTAFPIGSTGPAINQLAQKDQGGMKYSRVDDSSETPISNPSTTITSTRLDDVIVKVTAAGNDTTIGSKSLYFRLPFRKDVSVLTLDAATADQSFLNKGGIAGGVLLSANTDFGPFSLKDGAEDLTVRFDFAYELKEWTGSRATGANLVADAAGWSTGPDPGPLPRGLTATQTYRLRVTATARSGDADYLGAKREDFFFTAP